MGSMASDEDEAGKRAGVTSRRSGSGYDVGLRGQDALGTFEVGLAVDGIPGAGESLGLYVQAPRVGRLRVALSVTPEGVTRLAALDRRDDDGTPLPTAGMVAVDEGRTLRLQAQVKRYETALAEVEAERAQLARRAAALELERDEVLQRASALEAERDEVSQRAAALVAERDEVSERASSSTAERDEVTARAAALAAEREQLAERAAELQSQLAQANADHASEVEQRTSERERAQEALFVLREQLETEATELRGQLASAREALEAKESEAAAQREGEVAQLTQQLEALKSEQKELEAEAGRARSQVEAQENEVSLLTAKLEAAAAEGDGQVAALQAKLDAAQEESAGELAAVQAKLEAAQGEASAQLAALQSMLDAAQQEAGKSTSAQEEASRTSAEVTQLRAQLGRAQKKAEAASGQEGALREELRVLQARLEASETVGAGAALKLHEQKSALEAETSRLTAELRERDSKLSTLTIELKRASTGAPPKQTAEKLTAERDEARALARQLQANAAKITSERDEARNVARTLHQKMGSGEADGVRAELKEMRDTLIAERKIGAQLVTDKQRLQMQIDSLSRQLEAERSGRARISSERDELREKLSLGVKPKDFSREDTRPFELGPLRSTQTEVPVVPMPAEWTEERTEPGFKTAKMPARTTVKTDPMHGALAPKKGK
jgi:chromosome segregation ATPase